MFMLIFKDTISKNINVLTSKKLRSCVSCAFSLCWKLCLSKRFIDQNGHLDKKKDFHLELE